MITAYLTMDDGPSEITPGIMDYLMARHITPILFMLGVQLEEHFNEGIYAVQHGALIGNHTYSHPDFNELSYEQCIEEIEKQEELLDKLYMEAGEKRKYKLFRFPYGSAGQDNSSKLQDYLRSNGYARIDDRKITEECYIQAGFKDRQDIALTYDFGEWQLQCNNGFTMDTVMKRINDKNPTEGTVLLRDNTHHILLVHDHEGSNAIVKDYYKIILDYCLEQGIEFITPAFIT